jgi:type II secretory pathway component GspD/PulD (secretin)
MAALPSTIEVPLKHLDLATASQLIGGLFPGSVRFGGQPYSNSIFLSAPAEHLTIAARVLNQSDRAPFHVVIEALVVEFNSEVLQELGSDISGLASGAISALTTGFGTAGSQALTFTYTKGASNTAAFTALIDALVEENRARVISRPYAATLSGKPSTINITRDRFVLVPTLQGGLATTTPQAVTAGISLSITPTVSQDEMVRMDVAIEDASFLPVSGNVVIEVDRKKASTSMLVESGQSIVIGGLFFDRVSYGESGFPWLRHVPLLNLLFGKEVDTAQRQEVVVYVTPYIWAPGPEAPLPAKDTLSEREEGRHPIVLDRPQP